MRRFDFKMVVFAFLKYQHFIIVCISSKIDRILYNKNIKHIGKRIRKRESMI